MKIGKLALNVLKIHLERLTRKELPNFKPNPEYKHLDNVPYRNDGDFYHQFDVIYANENRKDVCIIDFHGGGYIYGNRKNNIRFGEIFVKEGFDFISMDYSLNKSTSRMENLFYDCLAGLEYIANHLEELNLKYNRFIITGDSAGGHIALLMTEIIRNEEFAKKFPYNATKLNVLAVMVNCPVYNFMEMGDNMLSKSGKKRMIGKNYDDMELRKLLDPKSNINCIDIPIMITTSKYDFIRNESIQAYELLKDRDNFKFIDVNSDNKKVAHVHNLVNPDLKESIYINNEMIKFANSVIK